MEEHEPRKGPKLTISSHQNTKWQKQNYLKPKNCVLFFSFYFFVTNSDTLIKIKHDQDWTGADTIRISQICDGKWLAEAGFSVTNLGKLDKIRHDQGFPNL